MARADDTELIDTFEEFYRSYYRNEIAELAQKYPNEQKSLYIDWQDLYRFDSDLADDFRNKPNQLREYAEEALRLYDLPVDVSLGQAHVRLRNLPETTGIREIRSDHRGMLISVQGIIRKATDVRPKITTAAFECQRCGTLTRIPQEGGDFQEPHECQGCERQGPFRINYDQSEFIDAQKLRVQESPEGLRGGETPQSIDVNIEDDVTGEVTPGDHVTATGILKLEQQGNDREKSAMFDVYMEGLTVDIEDEQFEEMEITDEDKKEIIELSNQPDLYEEMVGAIAPSIYGYEKEKQAMAFQLFSGVTKFLPDGSRTRGDLHILLVGDPGTGKCLKGDTKVALGDGRRKQIRELVEENLEDPKPVDDGVYDNVDISVPSLTTGGKIEERRATKVWKRETPDQMYRITTVSGRELEVTPSHPLFVQSDGQFVPQKAEDLSAGIEIAAKPETGVVADGGSTACRSRSGVSPQNVPYGVDAETERITSVSPVEPAYDWVYDLEVEETHNYISEGIISHNSQLLQYIKEIAPRSVYTSGKGSSSAGLCVTGDTLIHTADGYVPIRELAEQKHPHPVDTETSAPYAEAVQTFDREVGEMVERESSHLWRMPEKQCQRIETRHGKELEASTETTLLVCDESGIDWKPISDIEPGDYVGIPKYGELARSSPSVTDYFEYTNEKLDLTAESREFLRTRLCEEFGTLRDAAAALELSEDFIYDSLSNRYLPQDKLDRILDAVGASRDDIEVERAMLRHGDSIKIPETFDSDLLYLIGLVFGDGDIMVSRRGGNRGRVRISNSDEQLLETAAEIIESTFDRSVDIETQEDKVPCIRLHSATAARFFSNLGMQTPKESLQLDERLTTAEHAAAFLQGLFDADGSVSDRDTGGSSIHLSTISPELGRQVQLMLESYGVRALRRERDRRGTSERDDGREIESKSVQTHLEIYGQDIETYAEQIGFRSQEKSESLASIHSDTTRRGERLPVGSVLARTDGSGGEFYNNLTKGHNPDRERASDILDKRDLGAAGEIVAEAIAADLRWDEVVTTEATGQKEVFDLTVPETHNFVGNGIITHNTAAAVRDDFGEGQQWTLEAGALVLADQGIAAVDELDKMRCVTGDTMVHTPDGRIPIRKFVDQATESATVEELANGRTIRGIDEEVWTMTADETIERRDVTAVHEYQAPDSLLEVTLESGESVTATPDHPFFVRESGDRTTKPAAELSCGDRVCVPHAQASVATDGGTAIQTQQCEDPEEVVWRQVKEIETQSSEVGQRVYDLTIEETHNFVANNIVVHNSEDQSAMHEALEQQSYHPNSEVLLSDGRRVEIGELVDGKFEANPAEVVDGVDCEILPTDDIGVHTVDLDTNEVTKTAVDRVSRHEAPEEFVRVTFSNGRDVLVTPEHPMFVDQAGEIETVEATDIEAGAFVPAPRKLPNSAESVELDDEPQVGKEKDVTLPDSLSPALGEILGLLIAEGHSYAGSAHEIGFSNQDERLLDRFSRLMSDVFGIESSDTTNAAGTVTQRYISTKLYRWFESNVPEVMHTARDKRIPAAVLGASEEVIRRFLVGAFAGDGGVESEAMSFCTASEGLAEDYADALAKIGVGSRIHYTHHEDAWKTYVMGDSTERFVEKVVEPVDPRHEKAQSFVDRSNETARHHDVVPASVATDLRELRSLVGLSLTGQFRPHIDEEYGIQVETVETELRAIRERIESVRADLETATDLSEVRSTIGWSGRELAERIDGVTTSGVHYAENGGYDGEKRRDLARRAMEVANTALETAQRRVDELEAKTELRYYRVKDVETVPNEGEYACEWVYDVTVEPTNTFVSQGVVLHNSISVSKAGINATLKSRCSLLGAANPTYGRFDEYEPIGEQIDLAPPLISRFDLIFTVTDQPDEEADSELAEHILQTNYAGELNTHRTETNTSNYTEEEVERITDDVAPTIDAEFLRKYVAYAQRNCYPTMTEDAKSAIQDFYVDLRMQGSDEDAPVPVTARKLEALVRLAEASARVRLSDSVTEEDARRAIDIARYSLEDIGLDPETGELDADMIETGTSKSQRDRIKNVLQLIESIEEEYDDGAPVDIVIERAEEEGMETSKAEHEIDKLKQKGEVYEPRNNHLRTT